MYSPARLCCVLSLAMLWSSTGWSATRAKPAPKKTAKEISADDGLQKQMDWENKLLGPNTEKKIDLVKIQKLQAEETARREKQEKLDRADRERKDREAALAAQRKDVKAPSTRDVPAVVEAPVPARPVEKHDDAFVDKLPKEGKGSYNKKRPTVSNDDVDELLAKAKQDKGASIAPRPAKGGKSDSVDQLLATADKQQAIKTTTRKQSDVEPVSAELAARESALKAVALAAAKAQQERDRNKRLAIPDAAMLRAPQATASRVDAPAPRPVRATTAASRPGSSDDGAETGRSADETRATADQGGWKDPFASEPAPARSAKISTAVIPASARPGMESRRAPSVRPAATDDDGSSGSSVWKDPFDSDGASDGAAVKSRPAASPKAKHAKPRKRPAHWKDPFA